MKLINLFSCFIFSLLVTKNSCAQSEYYASYYDMEVYFLNTEPLLHPIPTGVKEIKYQVTEKNKSKTLIKRFDERGKLTGLYVIDKNDSLKPLTLLTYDENGNKKEIRFYDKKTGQIKTTYRYEHNPNKQITLLERKKENDKTTYKSIWKYNTSGCLEKSMVYKSGASIANSTYQYEYYDSCKKSQVKLYNKKEKLVDSWSYLCDESGVKNTATNSRGVCISQENVNDFIIKTFLYTDKKGKQKKYIYKYTIDTLIVEYSTYNEKNVLTAKHTYDKDHEKPIQLLWFKKGNISSQINYTYVNGLMASYSHAFHGKTSTQGAYSYNQEGVLTKVVYQSKKKNSYTIELNYSYY